MSEGTSRSPRDGKFANDKRQRRPLAGGRMHRLLTTIGRGFNERIGWKRLGIAASVVIIAVAITTLVRTLKGVDIGVILVALAEKPLLQIALAALCVVG